MGGRDRHDFMGFDCYVFQQIYYRYVKIYLFYVFFSSGCVCVCVWGGGGGGTVEQCKPSFDPQQVHIYLKAINLRKCIGNEQNNCSRYMAEQKFHSPPHDNEMVVPFTLK